jgi:hypothetical protein|tara:strand:+ start:171 stop:332 length:162 start_codon:yes stop_codon:yes gene_type:complete
MIKPEWHFMRDKDKPRLCSCIKKYEKCCGKVENENTSTTSGDLDITYNYNERD